MTLLFCDGFDSYAATVDLAKKWVQTNEAPWVWHATNGKTGAGCVQATTTGAGRFRIPTTSTLSTSNSGVVACLGFWLKISTTPGSIAILLRAIPTSFSNGSTIRVLTSGVLQLYDNGGSALGGFAGGVNVCDNTWHWVEVYWTFHSFASTIYKCYVDGVQQWNGTTFVSHGDCEFIEFVSITSVTISLDDVLIWDSSGSDLTAAMLPIGQKLISTLRPTSDSAVQFTRSTGSDNYALVDEVNPSSTDYVESGTSGQQDLYGYSDLGYTPASVTAVVLNTYVANPGGGSINFRAQAKSSATTRDGTSIIAPPNPHVFQEIVMKDPNGTIAWTGSAVDAATFGIKVV